MRLFPWIWTFLKYSSREYVKFTVSASVCKVGGSCKNVYAVKIWTSLLHEAAAVAAATASVFKAFL